MSKRNHARRMSRQEMAEASHGAIVSANDNRGEVQAFTFGEPELVLSRATMLDMLECYHNQRWYEPPISPAWPCPRVPRLAAPFQRDHPQAQHAGRQP